MTLRQYIMKAIYSLIMLKGKISPPQIGIMQNEKMVVPPVPFHGLKAVANDGSIMPFEQLKGKKVLLVNTASNCGYTGQYEELETLYKQHKDKLVVIAFPANDFREQEKGSDEEIAAFCKVNYGVSFPIMKKSVVVKSTEQNEVFYWLSNANQNGWCSQLPTWNFCKYLVNEDGVLTHYFEKEISPLSKEVVSAIG